MCATSCLWRRSTRPWFGGPPVSAPRIRRSGRNLGLRARAEADHDAGTECGRGGRRGVEGTTSSPPLARPNHRLLPSVDHRRVVVFPQHFGAGTRCQRHCDSDGWILEVRESFTLRTDDDPAPIRQGQDPRIVLQVHRVRMAQDRHPLTLQHSLVLSRPRGGDAKDLTTLIPSMLTRGSLRTEPTGPNSHNSCTTPVARNRFVGRRPGSRNHLSESVRISRTSPRSCTKSCPLPWPMP
jgi:hypothetical protein